MSQPCATHTARDVPIIRRGVANSPSNDWGGTAPSNRSADSSSMLAGFKSAPSSLPFGGPKPSPEACTVPVVTKAPSMSAAPPKGAMRFDRFCAACSGDTGVVAGLAAEGGSPASGAAVEDVRAATQTASSPGHASERALDPHGPEEGGTRVMRPSAPQVAGQRARRGRARVGTPTIEKAAIGSAPAPGVKRRRAPSTASGASSLATWLLPVPETATPDDAPRSCTTPALPGGNARVAAPIARTRVISSTRKLALRPLRALPSLPIARGRSIEGKLLLRLAPFGEQFRLHDGDAHSCLVPSSAAGAPSLHLSAEASGEAATSAAMCTAAGQVPCASKLATRPKEAASSSLPAAPMEHTEAATRIASELAPSIANGPSMFCLRSEVMQLIGDTEGGAKPIGVGEQSVMDERNATARAPSRAAASPSSSSTGASLERLDRFETAMVSAESCAFVSAGE
eukprot:scaffold210438_cov30-Tisochrysis_lutea.AAC.3